MSILVRPLNEDDRQWAEGILRDSWGATEIVTLGKVLDTRQLPGLVAVYRGKRGGLLTYDFRGRECEIVSLNSLVKRRGIGTMLLEAVASLGLKAGCTRLVLCTTNDNTHAMRFYQKRAFCISAVNLDAMKHYRVLKPNIPLTGQDGIPIRDEIVLKRPL
jgi:GNAT superfamily N-acetyltransferase